MQMKHQRSRVQMAALLHQYKPIANNPREIQAIPLVRSSKRPLRKICKCSDSQLGEFHTSLPRFGPIYYSADNSLDWAKENAWRQVWEKSTQDGDKEEILDIYLSAIRRVEKRARATYADGALDGFTESQFRWMMINDGCFFLQLALFILGASKQLGYPDDHVFFRTEQDKKVVVGWIKSMFFPGNQIPLVVLNELMKQTFFQNVITGHGKWERPTDHLSKGVLYDLVILPASDYANRKTSSTLLRGPARSTYLSEEQPSDLLHGLQNLVLGPGGSRNDSNEEDEEDEVDDEKEGDLEAGRTVKIEISHGKGTELCVSEEVDPEAGRKVKIEISDGNDKELCVSGFRKKGIHFWKSNGVGFRGIRFKNRMLYAGLYLPKIPLNRDTELVFKNLIYYEDCQQQNEIRSYLGLMKQIISTYEDVNLLASNGIIEASKPYYKERFLRMLKNLAQTATTHNHRHVMQQLRDYSSFPWEKFKYVAIIAFLLAIAQTVFGVLSYVVALAQLHQSPRP